MVYLIDIPFERLSTSDKIVDVEAYVVLVVVPHYIILDSIWCKKKFDFKHLHNRMLVICTFQQVQSYDM